MHPLHDYFARQLADKLTRRGVVVWYDPRREFTPFFDELRGGPRSGPALVPIKSPASPRSSPSLTDRCSSCGHWPSRWSLATCPASWSCTCRDVRVETYRCLPSPDTRSEPKNNVSASLLRLGSNSFAIVFTWVRAIGMPNGWLVALRCAR